MKTKPAYFESKCPECGEEAVGLRLEEEETRPQFWNLTWCAKGHVVWAEESEKKVLMRSPMEKPQ